VVSLSPAFECCGEIIDLVSAVLHSILLLSLIGSPREQFAKWAQWSFMIYLAVWPSNVVVSHLLLSIPNILGTASFLG
jgi:hypothetical protein